MEVLGVGQHYYKDREEVENQERSWHQICFTSSLLGEVFYDEVVVHDVTTGSAGGDDDDQETIDVEDIVDECCSQLESVVCYLARVEPLDDDEQHLEE